jgi:hypothetical protein
MRSQQSVRDNIIPSVLDKLDPIRQLKAFGGHGGILTKEDLSVI